jgi:hypothetical protein
LEILQTQEMLKEAQKTHNKAVAKTYKLLRKLLFGVRKPQRATVQQHILLMGVLNDYVRHLPMLKDSPKDIPTMKKWNNIPSGEADLAAIVLASVPMMWQNQDNLTA